MEKKGIKCSYAVLVCILFAALAFVVDYSIIERKTSKCNCTDCETVNNEVISDAVEENEYPIFNYYYENYKQDGGVKNATVKINNNAIELLDDSFAAHDITVYRGLIIFEEVFTGYSNLVIANSNGEILKRITSDDLMGNRFSSYEIRDNSIYINSVPYRGAHDMYDLCIPYNRNGSEKAFFVEKIDYLGSNMFSDFELVSSKSWDEYVNNEGYVDECSKDMYKQEFISYFFYKLKYLDVNNVTLKYFDICILHSYTYNYIFFY